MTIDRSGGRTRRRGLVAAAVLTLALAACGGVGRTAGGGDDDLPAGSWALVSGSGPDGEVELHDGLAGDEGTPIVLHVEEGRWGGTVCNSYGAQEVDAGDGTVRLDDVYATEMACLDDALMLAEQRYLAAFRAVERYEVVDGELRLTGPDVELVYEPALEEEAG